MAADNHAAVCTECPLFDAELDPDSPLQSSAPDHPGFADVCFADPDDLVAGEVIDALFPAVNGDPYAVFGEAVSAVW